LSYSVQREAFALVRSASNSILPNHWMPIRSKMGELADQQAFLSSQNLMNLSSRVPLPNFLVRNAHCEGDSVESAYPKSGFPDVHEDIGIFSYAICVLWGWNDKKIFESPVHCLDSRPW
jgi:hypothetical protein